MGKRARNRQNNVVNFEDSDAFFEKMDSHRSKGDKRTPSQSKYRKNITAKTEGQADLISAINENQMIMALGPAGTGKTYIAIAKAVEALNNGEIDRIIISRPAVEAGENLGFLPGDMSEKLDPYMQPIFDAILERMDAKKLDTLIRNKVIEIAPVAFMRGRTFSNAFVVVDEAQNATKTQLKMIMTRLGFNSKMIITGDPDQSDLPVSQSGLKEISEAIEGQIKGVGVVELDAVM